MKMHAQKQADLIGLLKAKTEANTANSKMMDDANKRGSPWTRKFIAIFIITIAFGGLLFAPLMHIPVDLILQIPKNSIAFGLIKWGKTYEVVSSTGFLIPEYVRYTVMAICGFFFGPGFAKTH